MMFKKIALVLTFVMAFAAFSSTAYAYEFNIPASGTEVYFTDAVVLKCDGVNNELQTNTSSYPVLFQPAYCPTWRAAAKAAWQSSFGQTRIKYYGFYTTYKQLQAEYRLTLRLDTRESQICNVQGMWLAY